MSDYVSRLEEVMRHPHVVEFVEAQIAQTAWWERAFVFFRRWILTHTILNFVHGRVVVIQKPKRFLVTSVCFVGMCFAMGEFDPIALGAFVLFNFVTIMLSDF